MDELPGREACLYGLVLGNHETVSMVLGYHVQPKVFDKASTTGRLYHHQALHARTTLAVVSTCNIECAR
jgi:hypothetical protein